MQPNATTVVLRILEKIRDKVTTDDEVSLDPKQSPTPTPSEQQQDQMAICYADFLLCMYVHAGNRVEEQRCRDEYCRCFDTIFNP